VKQFGYRRWFRRQFRLSLSDQFLLISFVILLGGMLLIGWWVANRIEDAVITQTANTTALYMKSVVAPLLQPLITQGTLDSAHHQQLQRLLVNTPLGQDIVSMKVWAPDGTILFSLEPALIGTRFPLDEDLQAAFSGQTVSHLSSLSRAEDVMERRLWSNLIETHVPVFAEGTKRVIAVTEFYQYSEPLLQQIASAQRQSWLIVAIATIVMYGLLSGLVARGSRTIDQQQAQLQQSVKDLGALLDENQVLHRRLQAAAAREAEINEQFLHRIGRDLHDGPAQDLALALLHLDEVCRANPPQLETIRHALQSALHEVRTLAAGLQLPELESLSTADVVRRAVREFQRKTGAAVELEPDPALPPLSLSKKIAIYRVIAEALYNSYRHAGAKNLHVQLGVTDQSIWADIADSGPGFDPATLSTDGNHLGIAGLQQRVALLAGSFDIQSHQDEGTRIHVSLPLEES
jgi:signal transduction histidine kinase